MSVNSKGHPIIATYWRPEGTKVPQYHIVWYDGLRWNTSQVGRRTTPFTLSSGGSKRIMISRPKVLVDSHDTIYVVFRDEERGSRVSIAVSESAGFDSWKIIDLSNSTVGFWEPNYDSVLWKRDNRLHLFVQYTGQGDAETLEDIPPQPVHVYKFILL